MSDRVDLQGFAPPDPPLDDGVVRLRALRDEDADAILRACQDPVIAHWVPIPVPYLREHAEAYIREGRRPWTETSEGRLAIADAATDELIGAFGVHPWEERRWSVGYWVAPWARRRGVATRALRLGSRWAMREFGLVRLALYTLDGNEASQRTAMAAGFRHEGTLRNYSEHRGELRDAVFFSLIPSDTTARD